MFVMKWYGLLDHGYSFKCHWKQKIEGLLTESLPYLFTRPQATITTDLQAIFPLYIKLNLLPKKITLVKVLG